jgi:prevent-host-death family protein
MCTLISITEAKRRFYEIVARVKQGECFRITVRGVPAAGLIPAKPGKVTTAGCEQELSSPKENV